MKLLITAPETRKLLKDLRKIRKQFEFAEGLRNILTEKYTIYSFKTIEEYLVELKEKCIIRNRDYLVKYYLRFEDILRRQENVQLQLMLISGFCYEISSFEYYKNEEHLIPKRIYELAELFKHSEKSEININLLIRDTLYTPNSCFQIVDKYSFFSPDKDFWETVAEVLDGKTRKSNERPKSRHFNTDWKLMILFYFSYLLS